MDSENLLKIEKFGKLLGLKLADTVFTWCAGKGFLLPGIPAKAYTQLSAIESIFAGLTGFAVIALRGPGT